MGDECGCEKCQTGMASEQGSSVWPVMRTETQAEGLARAQHGLYLVVTEGGISLRQQTYEI